VKKIHHQTQTQQQQHKADMQKDKRECRKCSHSQKKHWNTNNNGSRPPPTGKA
jgi:hypothetical protein